MSRMYILIIFIVTISHSCHQVQKQKLLIAAAANIQFAVEELIEAFEKNANISCELISNSSGMLCAQIKEGAPYDVFISADMVYPNYLYNEGICDQKPQVFANGKLILWSFQEEINLSIENIASIEVKKIGIPNPKNAPYGKAALEALEYYGMYELTKPKLVYGENVNQTNHFIYAKAVDFGITAKSVIFGKNIESQGIWVDIDPISYSPIQQGIVCIKNQKKPGNIKLARLFKEFLFSETGKAILNANGYQTTNL